MSFHKKTIINFAHLLGLTFPKIFLIKSKYRKSRLTIYNLHSTSKKYFNSYKEIIKKINTQDKFINPENIDDFFKQKYGDQSFSLLTIDDGFNNNLEFAEKVLEPLGLKAIFFIIPNFIDENENKSLNYFNALYPKKKDFLPRNLKNQFIPLSKRNIFKIQALGHTIGMHGFNHENFAKLKKDEMKILINKGINVFRSLNIKVNHFAYPFGDKNSFTLGSNKVLSKYFQYIHLGVRGSNKANKSIKEINLLKRHPLSNHKEDLIYFPVEFKEIKFFTLNRLSLLLNLVAKN